MLRKGQICQLLPGNINIATMAHTSISCMRNELSLLVTIKLAPKISCCPILNIVSTETFHSKLNIKLQ